MGVSEDTLLRTRGNLLEVSRRANLFLQSIQFLLPGSFSKRHKSPCWLAEKPRGILWEHMLMTYFHPQWPKKPMGGLESFAHYLRRPVEEKEGEEGVLEGHASNRSLICLPYFFLAGFPKCATTTVHDALHKHPEIVEPREKEPHWWARVLDLSRARNFSTDALPINFVTYTLFFNKISNKLDITKLASADHPSRLITYDGSQSTFWDSNFFNMGQEYCAMPAVVSRVLPDAKFVLVMRDPVSRLYSHFMYSCRIHYGSVHKWPLPMRRDSVRVFDMQVKRELKEFRRCLVEMSVFECVSAWTTRRTAKAEFLEGTQFSCGGIFHRLTIGMYIVHIKKWLQFYPRENFLFLRTEDLSRDPPAVMSRITSFLGVAPVSDESAHRMLGRPQNVFNASAHHILPMEESTEQLLREFYWPYNQQLASLLSDDRFLWTDQKTDSLGAK